MPEGHNGVADKATVLPPMVYVPTQQAERDAEDIEVQLRSLEDGRVALVVYSALDRLVACCGNAQPWALLPIGALTELEQSAPFQLVLLDVELPEEARQETGNADATSQHAEEP